MAAVMLAGAPLCNEAYAALANRANTITAVTSSAELQNGTKFIIKTAANQYYTTTEVPNTKTGVTYATVKATNETDVAKAAVFEATNVNVSPLGVSFELTVNGKPFALLKTEAAITTNTEKDAILTDFTAALSTGATEYKLDAIKLALIGSTATASSSAISGTNAALVSYKLDYNSVNLNEFSLSSTTFSFGSEAVEGNVFEGVVPFTFDRQGDLKASSPKGTYFVKGSDKDVKALKDAANQTDREAALKKLSIVTVLNEAYGINTSIPGEGYKLALVSGEEFYKAKDAANFANAAFINILEKDQLNAEGEIELAIKPIINKADGTSVVDGRTKLTIKSVKASVSDPKTYVTTVATNTKFEKVTNPVLGASTFFAATDFLKADEVSAYNVFFTSGDPQPENVTPQEYGRYLSAVSVYDRTTTANVYQLHATAPDNTIVDAPLSQWIVTNFDGKYTLTLKNREAGTTLNLKLEATDNAGEYKIIDALANKIENVVAANQELKGRTIKLIPTTLTKNDGYVVLSKEDMSGTIGVSFSGKDAIKGNQTYYMELNKNKNAFVPTLKASDAVEVNFALNKVDETASSTDLVINNYAYLDKDGRILTDAADTLAIPSYTVSYKIDKDTYYVTDNKLAVTKAKTATAAGAKKVVLKKHFNDSYVLAIPSNVKDAKNPDEAAVKPNGSKFASTAKINALKDADFAYVSLSLQDKNDYETLKAVSRHATFEAVNVAGGVSMQENKNGILEGIIGADALTFWLDTADSEKATPSFYISKGIAKAEETKAYNDEVRNFLFNPTDSAAIYNEGSATTAVDKKYILEGTKENLKAIFRPAALIAEDTMTTVVDGKELTVVAAKADAAKDQVNGLKNFQYGISLADKDVANEYVIKSRGNGQYLYNLNGKLGFTSNKNEALVVTLGEGDATANEAIAAENVAVIAGEGVVTVKGAAGKQVVVSNILGQVIANKVATSDEETIAVAAGVAVVVVDGEATKVVVK